uniref:BTB domain-containing protein n=1 Tax=Pseudo-nitzschia australis TaxID=44445 RepID=A0A7S4AQB6_9STRA
MLFASETELNLRSESFLTDERLLQEEMEYGGQLQRSHHSRSRYEHEQQQQQQQHQQQLYYEHNVPCDDDEYYGNIAQNTIVRAQHDQYYNDPHLLQTNNTSNNIMIGSNRNDEYYLPFNNDFSAPATTDNQLYNNITGGETTNRKLCWRSDPAESLSDWKLNVFNRSTKTFEIYHVHRVVLAVGPRGCEYFRDVFRQAEIGTTATATAAPSAISRTTRVPLIAESCKLVGCFLDYVYGNDRFETITSENALGMCYLADYFRNHSLWDLATDFIEDDLEGGAGREHLCQYYTDSVYYDQHEFLDHILAVCSVNLMPMLEEGVSCTKLLEELTPHHFLQVLGKMEQKQQGGNASFSLSSLSFSRVVTEYCRVHRNELSMESFDHITSRLVILDLSSALTLLETSLEYYDSGSYGMKGGGENRTNNAAKGVTVTCSDSSLVLFQQRCIETLSENWEELLDLDQHRVTRIMRTLALREDHRNILVDWFQRTLTRASNEVLASRQETKKAQQQMRPLEDRCRVMAKEVEAAEKETAVSQSNHTVTKSEMKTQISSWMRKNEGTNQQRQAEQQQWEHERLQWETERRQWKRERSRLKRELRAVRQALTLQPSAVAAAATNRDCCEDNCNYASNTRELTTTAADSRRDRPCAVIPNAVIPNDCGSSRLLGHSRSSPHILDDSRSSSRLLDDSRSCVTDSSSSEHNSFSDVADEFGRRRDSHEAFPLNNNGMSPPFRIF